MLDFIKFIFCYNRITLNKMLKKERKKKEKRHCFKIIAHFLLMGQSFMKCPIFPQIRQHLSFGASSPSVSTSGSKKYS